MHSLPRTLILTLALDTESQSHFEGLRQAHFPAERNQVPAHVTLFHQLPHGDEVIHTVGIAARRLAVFPLAVTGLRFLGRGVAYTLHSPILLALHHALSEEFEEFLIAQDRQRFQPHIVIQNKANPNDARALLAQLERRFVPRAVQAQGVTLWRYLDGPWQHLETHRFHD